MNFLKPMGRIIEDYYNDETVWWWIKSDNTKILSISLYHQYCETWSGKGIILLKLVSPILLISDNARISHWSGQLLQAYTNDYSSYHNITDNQYQRSTPLYHLKKFQFGQNDLENKKTFYVYSSSKFITTKKIKYKNTHASTQTYLITKKAHPNRENSARNLREIAPPQPLFRCFSSHFESVDSAHDISVSPRLAIVECEPSISLWEVAKCEI